MLYDDPLLCGFNVAIKGLVTLNCLEDRQVKTVLLLPRSSDTGRCIIFGRVGLSVCYSKIGIAGRGWLTLALLFIKFPLAKAGALRDDAVLFVCWSVACFYRATRMVLAPYIAYSIYGPRYKRGSEAQDWATCNHQSPVPSYQGDYVCSDISHELIHHKIIPVPFRQPSTVCQPTGAAGEADHVEPGSVPSSLTCNRPTLASTRRGFAHKIVPNGVQLWRRLCSPLGIIT